MTNTPRRPGTQPPGTRRDRREAARRDNRLAAASTAARKPAWQSPMLLLSLAAVAVGVVVIVFASGVLSSKGSSVGGLFTPIRATPTSLADPTNPHALGKADAPVTVDVWSDFQCPACQYFARTIEPDLIDQYVTPGLVRIVYRDMAFIDGTATSGESHQAAAAARCAGEQGSFWPFHDYLFENQKGENKGTFTRDFLDRIAVAVGIDQAKFDSCLSGDAAMQAVVTETQQGTQGGVRQTPTLGIDGTLQTPGALTMAQLSPLIDAALAKKGVTPVPSGSVAPAASAAPASPTPASAAPASPAPSATP